MTDPFAEFKARQREAWSLFAPLETVTTIPAASLVRFAGVEPDQRVLDVACGTGVVAITAARAGARVDGLDLTPALLERARYNASVAGVAIEFVEGDAEALPYPDASFDVVLSQYGHMFAPRPDVTIGEMLRVLKPGGRIAFSTWPPEHFVGRMFALVGKYVPPPPGVAPSPQWGDPNIVRSRLGDAVVDLAFERGIMWFPALSVQHYRVSIEATSGPVIKLVESLTEKDPARLAAFRADLEAVVGESFADNAVRQDYLMSRASKR